ncbi:MAG: hypothetical protein K9M19_06190 [Candidatus Marinimicrobia bacterium]|nr:hypothetical protein [Candidatus Neomarinimicrobiota bacterium]
MSEHSHTPLHEKPGYEKADIQLKWVAVVGVLFVVMLAAIAIGTKSQFIKDKNEVIYEQVLQPASPQLRDVRAHDEALLNDYQIISRPKGIYQIPIEQAMQVMAERAYRAHQSER